MNVIRETAKLKVPYFSSTPTNESESKPSSIKSFKKQAAKSPKIDKNPNEFIESLNYYDKRVFQNILFPKGFMFSLKTKNIGTAR